MISALECSRRVRRLFHFVWIATLICTSIHVRAAEPTRVSVHDVIYRADGTPASGTLLISWPSFRAPSGATVASGSRSVELAQDGSFTVELVPTEAATPSGVQYRVVLQMAGAPAEVQYWGISSTGQTIVGTAGGTEAARAVAPEIPPYVLKSGDVMTGPLTLYGEPADVREAATKQYVDTAVDKARAAPSVTDFGAACDGAGQFDDTDAIQAAINSFAGHGGTLRIPDGCYVTRKLTFPTFNGVHRGNLVLELEGSLFLDATLELPANVSLIGKAGSVGVQFQVGRIARLEEWGTLNPVLQLTGGNNHVENISIPWATSTGIRLSSSNATSPAAIARLENVGVTADGNALMIDRYFWVWARDSRFHTHGPTSVWITNTQPGVGEAGLVYFDDVILGGGGIRLDSQVTVSNIGSLYLNRLMRESGVGPLLTLDSSHGDIEIVSVNHAADADPVNVQEQVKIISPSGTGRVYGLHIIGQPLSIGGDTSRAQVYFDGNDDTRFVDLNLGSSRFANYAVRSRVWDIDSVANDFAPAPASPYASLPVNQDPTTWPTGGGTWTQNVLAPDGSTRAATLTSTSGVADAQIYDANLPVTAGDWVIAGVYVNGTPDSAFPPALSFVAAELPMIDSSGTNYMNMTPRGFFDTQWRLALAYGKVTSAGSGTARYVLSLRANPAHPVSYAFPFAYRIPASANVSDSEILRWVRFMMRNVVPGIPAGNYALRQHQKLYFGSDTFIGRGSTGQLVTSAGAWSAGTTLPSSCAVGDLHFKTTAPIGLQQCSAANTWTAVGGTSTVTAGGSNGDVQCNSGGSLGACSTTGTGNVVRAASPAFTGTPTFDSSSSPAGTSFTGNFTSAGAVLSVSQQGAFSGNLPWALKVTGYSSLGGFRINGADANAGIYIGTASGVSSTPLSFAADLGQPITFSHYNAGFTERARLLPDGSGLQLTPTWNNAATNFTAFKINATNTASGASALLLDAQVGGVSKFSVDKNGAANASKFCHTATVCDFYGAGTPEGAVSASIGSTYRRTDGGAGTTLYVKESGTGSTGWVAK